MKAETTRKVSPPSARSESPGSRAVEDGASVINRKEDDVQVRRKVDTGGEHGRSRRADGCSDLAPQAADPIKVGVVTPLSGSYAPIGKQVRWGAELAVKEINAAGGVNGRPFELLFEDEEANPPVAVRKSEKLLQQDKVDLLTGTVNSGSTLAVGQVAERNNRILVTTVSYAPSITGAQCNPNVFRVNANAFMQSNALTAWLVKNIPAGATSSSGRTTRWAAARSGLSRRHQASRRHRCRRDLSARRQVSPPTWSDPGGAAGRDHDGDCRERHRAPAHATQGVRDSQR